jgi:hypothetical protein
MKWMIHPFALPCSIFSPLWTIAFVFMTTTCTASSWYSKIFSLCNEGISFASMKIRNETARLIFERLECQKRNTISKMFHEWYLYPKRKKIHTAIAVNDQSIRSENVQNFTDSGTRQSLTDTVSVSSHLNTSRPNSSSVWVTNLTYNVVRILTWVSIYQSIHSFLKKRIMML